MKILALEYEIPGTSQADYKKVSKAEARRVWELIEEAKIREIYFRSDENSAVILLECQDLQEAKKTLDSLPMVHTGLIDFELIPLKPYPGFARLFDNDKETGID